MCLQCLERTFWVHDLRSLWAVAMLLDRLLLDRWRAATLRGMEGGEAEGLRSLFLDLPLGFRARGGGGGGGLVVSCSVLSERALFTRPLMNLSGLPGCPSSSWDDAILRCFG